MPKRFTNGLTSDVPIAVTSGGTGGATAAAGLNNLLPVQPGNSGKVLGTDGANASWVASGGGATVGTATVAFGAFPGSAQARVTVSGQTAILTTSQVEAWARCEDSADHSAEEHGIEDFEVQAQSVVAANGFTVIVRPRVGRCYGTYNFSWMWT